MYILPQIFQSVDFGNRTLADLLSNECEVYKLSGHCSQQMKQQSAGV